MKMTRMQIKRYKSRFAKTTINESKLNLLKIYSVLTTVFAIVAISSIFILYNKLEKTEIAYKTTSEENIKLSLCDESNKKQIIALSSALLTIDNQNIELVNQYNEVSEKLTDLEAREELYDKYSYAINYRGQRTDITYEQLQTVERVCEENDVDPDLLLGVILTESGGNEKAKNSSSTAMGYGQLLQGTAKRVYEKYMDKDDTYKHDYALDGNLNIEMAAVYLGELIKTKGSVREALYSYRGLRDDNYVNSVLSKSNV